MIDLSEADARIVADILARLVPECEVLAFGSRVNGNAQRYSDLDLVIVGPAPLELRRLGQLKDAFSESDLPILVDVLDWHRLSPTFRKDIMTTAKVIHAAQGAE